MRDIRDKCCVLKENKRARENKTENKFEHKEARAERMLTAFVWKLINLVMDNGLETIAVRETDHSLVGYLDRLKFGLRS